MGEWYLQINNVTIGGSSNGRTRDFDSRYLGSNPSPPGEKNFRCFRPLWGRLHFDYDTQKKPDTLLHLNKPCEAEGDQKHYKKRMLS